MPSTLRRKETTQELDQLAMAYLDAKMAVIDAGFSFEIDWQENIDFDRVNESGFLREAAWVVLASGFRESVVRKVFPYISDSFLNWESADAIVANRAACLSSAVEWFGNRRKIEAIGNIASQVHERGVDRIKSDVRTKGICSLEWLDFIGPITSHHLAKNLGYETAKPDRHLERVSASVGCPCPQTLCRTLADYISEPVAVVDIVLWRFFALSAISPFSSLATCGIAW